MAKKDSTKRSAAKAQAGNFNSVLIIRLVAASILFAASLLFTKLPEFVNIIILAVAAAAAGYDIAIEAIDYALDKDYFATPLVIVFVTLVSLTPALILPEAMGLIVSFLANPPA